MFSSLKLKQTVFEINLRSDDNSQLENAVYFYFHFINNWAQAVKSQNKSFTTQIKSKVKKQK